MELASAAPAPPPLEPQPSGPSIGGGKNPNTKRCGTCRKHLGTARFHKNPRAKDGLQTSCADCRNEKARIKNLGDACQRRDARPKVRYSRVCNRCNEPYKGRGRLLCDGCLDLANLAGPMAEAAGDGCFRASARRGA